MLKSFSIEIERDLSKGKGVFHAIATEVHYDPARCTMSRTATAIAAIPQDARVCVACAFDVHPANVNFASIGLDEAGTVAEIMQMELDVTCNEVHFRGTIKEFLEQPYVIC